MRYLSLEQVLVWLVHILLEVLQCMRAHYIFKQQPFAPVGNVLKRKSGENKKCLLFCSIIIC